MNNEQDKLEGNQSSESELAQGLAQDYPLAFNNYFGQDKRPTHPLGRGIPKNSPLLQK